MTMKCVNGIDFDRLRATHNLIEADTVGFIAKPPYEPTIVWKSFSSGNLLTSPGWDTVRWVSFAPLALAVAGLTMALVRTASPIEREGM
jgi:hypothetical protein